MGSRHAAHGGRVNLNHPTYLRIIEMVQKNEIDSYRTLAIAVGAGQATIMERAHALEERGRLTRTQNGVFIALTPPLNEPKSGLFLKPLPPLTNEQRAAIRRESVLKTHAENRAINPPKAPYRPYRARRPTLVLDAVIEQSETAFQDAPPDDPELGRQIIEAKPKSRLDQRAFKSAKLEARIAARAMKHEDREAKRRSESAKGRARFEAMESRRIAQAEVARIAKELSRAQRAQASEARREAKRAARVVTKAIERRELEERRLARGMKSGRCKFCKECMDLTERRPADGSACPGCGERFEKEVIERFSEGGCSPLATFDGH